MSQCAHVGIVECNFEWKRYPADLYKGIGFRFQLRKRDLQRGPRASKDTYTLGRSEPTLGEENLRMDNIIEASSDTRRE